jgi:hypothetical protein
MVGGRESVHVVARLRQVYCRRSQVLDYRKRGRSLHPRWLAHRRSDWHVSTMPNAIWKVGDNQVA